MPKAKRFNTMPTYLADSIPNMPEPFSGPNYRKNSDKCGEFEPCAICGKAVKDRHAHMVNVADGGGIFVSEAEAEQLRVEGDAGLMNGFPIGPECWRKHKAAFLALEPKQVLPRKKTIPPALKLNDELGLTNAKQESQPFTVGDLRDLLAQLPADLPVVCAADSEGNAFSALSRVWHAELFAADQWRYFDQGGETPRPCLVLFPSSQ